MGVVLLKDYIWDFDAEVIRAAADIMAKSPVPVRAVNPRAERICKMIETSNGQLRISEIAALTGCSERHVHRLMKSAYGIGPKEYARVVRIRCAVGRMLADSSRDITAYMEGLGFSDQAHFQREFKWYAGMTPGKFLRLCGEKA